MGVGGDEGGADVYMQLCVLSVSILLYFNKGFIQLCGRFEFESIIILYLYMYVIYFNSVL